MSNTPWENWEESIENYNYKKSTNIKKFASSFIKEQTTWENQNKKK